MGRILKEWLAVNWSKILYVGVIVVIIVRLSLTLVEIQQVCIQSNWTAGGCGSNGTMGG